MKPFTIFQEYNLDYTTRRGISIQVHISDLHFGVMDPKTEYDILKEQFIDKIRDLSLDCISIDGDLFDRLMMSNTDAILYANLFIKDLYEICRNSDRHTVLLILAGTKSHDADQLKLFYPYLDDPAVDFRIVEEMRFEIINGCKILCIPELYDIPESEYQKYLFQSGYDMAFMHGAVEGSVIDDPNRSYRLFTDQDFSYCFGPVIAGHIHVPGCYFGYCYYNGSPIRWSFGEEQTKGFQVVCYDMDTRKYYVHFQPITSFKYETLDIDDILTTDPHKAIEYIENLKEEKNIDYIRLKCISSPDIKGNLDIIRDYYSKDKSVKFKIESMSTSEKRAREREDIYEKYKYLFENLTPYQKFARFVNDNEGSVIVTADEIIKILKEEV